MTKFTAACLLGTALLVFVSAGCFVGTMSGEKHTGPVTVRNDDSSRGAFEFIRANGELFEMSFDPHHLGPQIHKGDSLGDLVYSDEKDHEAFFVKAVLLHEYIAPPSPPLDSKVLYESQSVQYTCWGSGNCAQYNSSTNAKFYRWSDGGYREKPEPKKK